jgi:hypothetical protein
LQESHRRLRLCLVAAALAISASARPAPPSGEDGEAPTPTVTFARDVMPVLGRYCEDCHGAKHQHGGLQLDGYADLMRGGDSGPAVVPGDPASSLLVAKIERRDRPAMPPKRRLPAAVIARIRAWIAAGAEP